MVGLTTEKVENSWRKWFDTRVQKDRTALLGMMSRDYISTHSDGTRRTRDKYIALFTDPQRQVDIALEDTRMRISLPDYLYKSGINFVIS